MDQLLLSWNMLAPQKKLVAILGTIAILVVLTGLGRLANTPNMALLYSGLDSKTSAEIVSSLEQKSIAFEIRGDALYIDASERDRARLSLASEGLPANGVSGYELLDEMSGFGVTSQMFDAAYWRAKEGELARTILTSASIEMARVHIANPVKRPFDRDVQPTASVTVSSRSGVLDMGQAEAIRHMVAAAVSGLSPQQVAVIDAEYGVILEPGEAATARGNTGNLDSRAQELRQNIERLLSARVGAGNVIVEVMVETNTNSETVTERVIDPEGSVAISSDSESSTESSTGGSGGAVTVASNLPDGEGGEGAQSSQNESRTRDIINYEISETLRERISPAGQIARLSVAVLVNGELTTNANGAETYAARSPEEMAAFQSLVQSAVGFNAERGDIVTIETMQFPEALPLGTSASSGMFSGFLVNATLIIQMLILAAVALVLGMFVVKPILSGGAPELDQLTLEPLGGDMAFPELPMATSLTLDAAPQDPVDILRDTISMRGAESSHLLRNWIETDPAENLEATS